MNIGIFHNRYLQSGGEDLVVDSDAELLEKAGHTVVRCIVDNADALARPFGAWRVAWRARSNPASARRVASLLRDTPLDVAHVHNHFPVLSPSLHAALHERGVPVVQTLHNYRLVCANGTLMREGRICEECVDRGPWNAVRHGCYRGSRLQTLVWADATAHHRARGTWQRNVDRFTAPSAFAARKLAAAGIAAERIEVLANFVADPGDPAPPGEGAVYLGRLSPEKGVDLLIEAWRSQHGAPLTIVGTGPAEVALRAQARDVPGVRFVGARPRDGVIAALRAAAFAVAPSRWYEVAPLAVLEALACGRPVVAWRGGALGEAVEDDRSGLLFDEPTPESVGAACATLLGDPARVARLAAGARERYLDHHAPDAARAARERLYADVIATRGRRTR